MIVIAHPSNESNLTCVMNLRKDGFNPIRVLRCVILCVQIRKTQWFFMFRESKKSKEDSKMDYFLNLVP